MKKRTLKNTLLTVGIIVIALILRSCAIPPISTKSVSFNSNSEYGLVVGTVTFPQEKARFNGYFPNFHSLETDKTVAKKNSTEIKIMPAAVTRMRHRGELNNGKTYLFAFERVPGKYEVSGVRMATVGYGGAVRDYHVGKLSIPFEVKKGEVIYVGEININEYAFKGETLISLTDNYERDIQALKQKRPSVKWDLTKKSELKITYK